MLASTLHSLASLGWLALASWAALQHRIGVDDVALGRMWRAQPGSRARVPLMGPGFAGTGPRPGTRLKVGRPPDAGF
jgi:hypothetical protein